MADFSIRRMSCEFGESVASFKNFYCHGKSVQSAIFAVINLGKNHSLSAHAAAKVGHAPWNQNRVRGWFMWWKGGRKKLTETLHQTLQAYGELFVSRWGE